ncbi:MAG TPA: hypothetical protein VGG08_03705 [Solirubrobacteraceae bacterium]|jgi:hypothetical protein
MERELQAAGGYEAKGDKKNQEASEAAARLFVEIADEQGCFSPTVVKVIQGPGASVPITKAPVAPQARRRS